MSRPRIIPVLLLQNGGLVKTKQFADPRYIGDPINAVKIFSDLSADELIVLDILATKEQNATPAAIDELADKLHLNTSTKSTFAPRLIHLTKIVFFSYLCQPQ